jgi:glycerol-3-phosphate dehydrogenase (NAD(P)+)
MSRTSGHDGAVTVFGAGAWGTVLAAMLARGATRVTLWVRRPDQAAALSRTRENPAYLPGFPLPDNVDVTADVTAAAKAAELAIVAVPSRAVRALVRALPGNALPGRGGSPLALVLAAKGIEATRFRRLSEVVAEERPGTPVAVLSGPNLAAEIAAGKPAAATVASHDGALAQRVQDLFRPSHLRVYTSADVVGVEVAGALKNVIALAAGMSDGLGLGDNGKAALIARGLAEIVRLGTLLGGEPRTFYGLAGVGDLVATCVSAQSRNHLAGERLARGATLAEIEASGLTAEGIPTALAVHRMRLEMGVEMPISSAVYRVVFEGRPVDAALRALMQRVAGAE